MISSPIKRLGLLAAFVSLGACALASNHLYQQIKIDRAINSPTLAVKYNGVHATLMELRLNGESMGTRTMDASSDNGETTFSINVLSLKDGDNEVEIRLYDKDGNVVGSEKTTITTDSDTKGPVFLTTPKVGDSVMGPCEITVGFGRDFKNTYVSFFIDNQFKSMMNFPPFTYVWDTTRETNGWHEVEAWVVDDTSATYKTRKVRVFVNNPGGHTYRPNPTPATPIKAPAKAIKAAKLPALPDPRTALTPSTNNVAATTNSIEAPVKTILNTTATVAAVKTTAVAPSIVGITIDNFVNPKLEGHTAGTKPAVTPQSTSVGPRLMTPTGKRNVETKAVVAKPTAQSPVATAQSPKPAPAKVVITKSDDQTVSSNPVSANVADVNATTKTITAPQSQPSQPQSAPSTPTPVIVPAVVVAAPAPVAPKNDDSTLVALVPPTKPEAPATHLHPLNLDMSDGGTSSATMHTTSEPAAPVVPAPQTAPVTSAAMNSMGSTDSIIKPVKHFANKPFTVSGLGKKFIDVEYGTRLPIKGNYAISIDGSPVVFDVEPSIHAGVPVTPFRQLIEKQGGQINWQGDVHEVTAVSDGQNIWLKIGDRYAKINDEAIKLELAPFIESGRTIVPLSFISSALNVDVDYDKATGHVLITSKK